MIAIVFTVQGDANGFSTTVDGRLGYPKNGVDIGGGIHVPTALGRTVRHGDVIKHPTLSLWRYPDDAVVENERGQGLVLPVTASVQTLDAAWFP